MRVDRRAFVKGVAAAATAVPLWSQQHGQVPLGLQTYTFHNVRQGGLDAVDAMIDGMRALRVNLCELWAPQTEPFTLPVTYWAPWRQTKDSGTPAALTAAQKEMRRSEVRAWRTSTPAGYFAEIRRRFDRSSIRLFAYNYSFEPTMTDAEIEHGFQAAKEMRLSLITASSKPSVATRVVPFAEKYGMTVAFHNHSNLKDADDVATPESFRAVLAMSPRFRINLDVAHFAAAGFDSVAFLEQNHANVTNLHVHDRLANDGKSVPYGEGVAPIQQVLTLVHDRGWDIPCFYELEYVGADGRDVLAETRRELAYEMRVLRS